MHSKFEPRINVTTLGVADVAGAAAFYERIGFRKAAAASSEGVAFFPLMGGGVLALYGRGNLAADMEIADAGSGFGGITLSYNTRSRSEVEELINAFASAGGRVLTQPHEVFWGGYVGYAADPDGHPWEIAFNPHWQVEEDGQIRLPQ